MLFFSPWQRDTAHLVSAHLSSARQLHGPIQLSTTHGPWPMPTSKLLIEIQPLNPDPLQLPSMPLELGCGRMMVPFTPQEVEEQLCERLNTTPFPLHGGEGRTQHAGGCIGLNGISGDIKEILDLRGLPEAMRSQASPGRSPSDQHTAQFTVAFLGQKQRISSPSGSAKQTLACCLGTANKFQQGGCSCHALMN